ncbi:MAG: CHASE4 domain-containing protein [Desulfosarcinaceae bacterium]|nr:CHASE4 domain-containing protein [Desulfosarcinaceae bacterium]
MTLKRKILALLCVAVAIFIAVEHLIQRAYITPTFIALEREEARRSNQRCVDAIRREVHHLDRFTDDWAAWDDTYRFVTDGNPAYVTSNLGRQTFVDNRLHLIFICDAGGRVVWGEARDPITFTLLHLAQFPAQALPSTHALLQHGHANSAISGIFPTSRGPAMIASRPIISSDRRLPPRGTLIMGRFFEAGLIEILVGQTHIDFQVWPVAGTALPATAQAALTRIDPQYPICFDETAAALHTYSVIDDIGGAATLLLRSETAREISARGEAAVQFALVSNLAAGLLVLAVLWLLLNRSVIEPLSALTRQVMAVRDFDDVSKGFVLKRRDEIGWLSRQFDRMVKQLDAIQQNLKHRIADRTADLTVANQRLEAEVAERIAAEKALQQSSDDLERQVCERTAALLEINRRLILEVEERKRSEAALQRTHAKLRSLSAELLLTEERERHRIATELHDRIGQALTLARLQVDALSAAAAEGSGGEDLDRVGDLLDQTLQDTRQLTFELSPPVLYELGLEAALEWLSEQFAQQHDLSIRFEDDGQPKPLDASVRVFLFQATRELLFNVVKHAQASQVRVAVQRVDGAIRIAVNDNGLGFDAGRPASSADTNGGFGLFSIRERFHHLGGRLVIRSEPGKGSRLVLTAPLARLSQREAV